MTLEALIRRNGDRLAAALAPAPFKDFTVTVDVADNGGRSFQWPVRAYSKADALDRARTAASREDYDVLDVRNARLGTY